MSATIKWATQNTWEAEMKVEQLISKGVAGARVIYPKGNETYTYVEVPTVSIISHFSKTNGLF